jgi:TatD DNase family protein
MFSSIADQQVVFVTQMEIAKEQNLPVFLYYRDRKQPNGETSKNCHEDFVAILENYPTVKKVVHGFTDDRLFVLKKLLSIPHTYIGIPSWIADARANKDLYANVKHIPLDKLMIETDAPFLVQILCS